MGTLESKISPSILLIIIIIAIIFFISGLLHLLVRFLLKPNNRNPNQTNEEDDDDDDLTVLQGQLQQLFYLHDAGIDQSFIDTLPLFHYNSIINLKDPFDCAVCLCEFEPDDRLRLLPQCSHAFHTHCIDTWLLSHSTCPLCRSNLLDGISPRSARLPIVRVLESDHDGSDQEEETEVSDKFVSVKLGKFRNVDGLGESSDVSNNVVSSRRCYSMGSFEYVMDENSSLQVPIKKPRSKKSGFFRSEYGADSRREFSGIQIHGKGESERFSIDNGGEEEIGSCYSVESNGTSTSSTKKTLFWLMGRHQNKASSNL